MDTINFIAIDAPLWVYLLTGISGMLIFLRVFFGSLSRVANVLLMLFLILSLIGCQVNDQNLAMACVSYLLMVFSSFIFLAVFDRIIYFICRQRDKKILIERLQRQKDCVDTPGGFSGEYC